MLSTSPPILILLCVLQLLWSQTAAYLVNHQHIIHHYRSRSSLATTSRLSATSTSNDPNAQHITQILADKMEQLLNDASKLEEQSPISVVPEDNDLRDTFLTTEQRVYETLLSSRLELPFLNRSHVDQSQIEGAGRGLFASEDIKEGEVITCYPGDALLCELPSTEEGDEEDASFDFDDDENEAVDEVVLWGTHVSNANRWDDDTVFDGSESNPPLTSYAVTMNDEYSVMGHPSLDDNPAYIGHFANDGAGHLAYEMPDSPSNIEASLELGLDTDGEVGVEDNIAAYVLKSFDVANAMHQPLDEDELHMVTVATRDIAKGEEILVTYGPDYWISDYAGHSVADSAGDDS